MTSITISPGLFADPENTDGARPAKRRKVAAKRPAAPRKPQQSAPAAERDSGSQDSDQEPDAGPGARRPSATAKQVTRQAGSPPKEAGRQHSSARPPAATASRRGSAAVQQQPVTEPTEAGPFRKLPAPVQRQRRRSAAQKVALAKGKGSEGSPSHAASPSKAAEAEPVKPARKPRNGKKRKVDSKEAPENASTPEDGEGMPDGAANQDARLTIAAVAGTHSAAGDDVPFSVVLLRCAATASGSNFEAASFSSNSLCTHHGCLQP